MSVIKRIAVLTSGGDAPGMNAAVRAATRCALAQDWDVVGVRRGYAGLVEGEVEPLTGRNVSNIMQRGGTMLGSACCPEFDTEITRRQAVSTLQQNRIDALVVIGGNGSQTGAFALAKMGVPVVGVASTIDNDLAGSEITIGVDTALNIALEAIDRLKTTASSHQRAFLVEVMGRKCGYLALMAGLAGGAEIVVIPERETTPEEWSNNCAQLMNEAKNMLWPSSPMARCTMPVTGWLVPRPFRADRLRPAHHHAWARAPRWHADCLRPIIRYSSRCWGSRGADAWRTRSSRGTEREPGDHNASGRGGWRPEGHRSGAFPAGIRSGTVMDKLLQAKEVGMNDSQKDPVCGMVVMPGTSLPFTFEGQTISFCSEYCRDKFQQHPKRYLATTALADDDAKERRRVAYFTMEIALV